MALVRGLGPVALLPSLLLLAGLASTAVAQTSEQQPSSTVGSRTASRNLRLVDRIVAVVDEDPILLSDVERALRLGLVDPPPQPGESDEEVGRRVLAELIEQRLRFHEVDRVGLVEVPVEQIEAQVEEIRSRFPTEEAYQQRLRELSLTEEGLKQLAARQLAILTYIERRLGSRVFVSLDDIRSYYEQVMAPALSAKGEAVPPLGEVREQIRAVLREQHLNEEVVRWTAELERQADVVNLWERRHDRLPPVVDTVDEPAKER